MDETHKTVLVRRKGKNGVAVLAFKGVGRPQKRHGSKGRVHRVIKKYGDTCHLCGKPGADTADHVIPLSLGGTHSMSNLRPAHLECNLRKGNTL